MLKQQRATEVITAQHTDILQAIALLQSDLDTMTSSVDPQRATWGDISKWAATAEIARDIIARYAERA